MKEKLTLCILLSLLTIVVVHILVDAFNSQTDDLSLLISILWHVCILLMINFCCIYLLLQHQAEFIFSMAFISVKSSTISVDIYSSVESSSKVGVRECIFLICTECFVKSEWMLHTLMEKYIPVLPKKREQLIHIMWPVDHVTMYKCLHQ